MKLFRIIANTLIRFRWLVLLLFVAITACAVYFAQQIEFDFSPEALITNDDSVLVHQSHDDFGKETRFIVVALQSLGEQDAFSPEALNWQYETSLRLNQLDGTNKIKGLATIHLPRKVSLGNQKKTVWLFGTKEHDLETADKVRNKVKEVKQLRGPFVSDDMRCTGILVFLKDEVKKISEIKQATDAIDETLDQHPCPDGYKVHVSGIPYLRVKIIDQLKADQKFLIPLAGCFLGIVMALLFRCLGSVVLPPIALGCGVIWTIAILAITNNPINIITNVLPVILLVIGSSNCVHLLNRYAEEARGGIPGESNSGTSNGKSNGTSNLVSMRETMIHMIPACLLATITTAIGFASLVFTGSEILQGFGWQSAMGLAMIFVTIVATYISIGPSFAAPLLAPDNRIRKWSQLNSRAESLCLYSVKHPKLILALAMIPIIVSVIASTGLLGFKGVEVNSFLADTLEKHNPEVESLAVIDDQLGGLFPIEVILTAKEPGHLTSIDVMNRVRRVKTELKKHDDVSLFHSLTDVFALVDSQVTGKNVIPEHGPIVDDDPAQRRIRRIRDQLLSKRVSSGLSLFLTKDQTKARLLINLKDTGSVRGRAIIEDLERLLANEFPDPGPVQFELTGEMYVGLYALDNFVIELLTSLFVAMVIIIFVLALFFGSVKIGLISIVPNMTPLIVTLGYMGIRGYDLNVANVTVFAIGLGIAVDDTIHFLSRYRDEFLADGKVVPAIARTARGSGTAIVLTTILIIGGMAVLLNSSFIPTKRFAELTIVTMAAALAGDLLMLPAIIGLVDRDRAVKE